MSYYTGPSERAEYKESGWQHKFKFVTNVFVRPSTESKHTLYQQERRGSTSRRSSSGNYERQAAWRDPSSRRYPPTSNNKIFDREYAEHYNATPPPHPRSSSHSQPAYPAEIFHSLQRSISNGTRRESHSPYQRPTVERPQPAFSVSSESQYDTYGRHNTLRDQYRHATGVVDDEHDSKGRQPKSQRRESTAPYEDERRHHTSSRKSSHTGKSRPAVPSQYEMLQAEVNSLLSANIRTQAKAESAWNRKSWDKASELYGRLVSDLLRLSDLDRQLGGPNYMDYQRQADKAAEWQKMAVESSWISSHRRQYDGYIADAEAFENGSGEHLAKANHAYASAIVMLFKLKNTAPERLHAHYPGCIEYLEQKQRRVQARIDKQISEEDRKAANAVRKFVDEFHLVEKLIEQGDGPRARCQFDRAKLTFVETLATLPQRFVPSREWINKMKASIDDQAMRARDRFGEDW